MDFYLFLPYFYDVKFFEKTAKFHRIDIDFFFLIVYDNIAKYGIPKTRYYFLMKEV